MKFKNYKREYEKVFTNEDAIKKKCDIDKVSVYNDVLPINEYQNLYKEAIADLRKGVFDPLVKATWLSRQFCYRGKRRTRTKGNGFMLDSAFGLYTRNYVNFDSRLLTRSVPFRSVATYFDDFFPNFSEGNPFKEEYVYPYKYMSLECLIVVYQMDERLDLLREGEKAKMPYTKFVDYVLNYISCFNEEHGDTYLFTFSHVYLPYIKKI